MLTSTLLTSTVQLWLINRYLHFDMVQLEILEAKAILLFQNGHYRASAYFYVQAHYFTSNVSQSLGPLEVSWRRELELQNVRVLLNTAAAYLKSAKFELWLNGDAGELISMANYFAYEAFKSLQQYHQIPTNIAQRNIRVLFQAPLHLQLSELPQYYS